MPSRLELIAFQSFPTIGVPVGDLLSIAVDTFDGAAVMLGANVGDVVAASNDASFVGGRVSAVCVGEVAVGTCVGTASALSGKVGTAIGACTATAVAPAGDQISLVATKSRSPDNRRPGLAARIAFVSVDRAGKRHSD
jgi:hypothetical protein